MSFNSHAASQNVMDQGLGMPIWKCLCSTTLLMLQCYQRMSFFSEGWITTFGLVPDYINMAATMSNITLGNSIPSLEAVNKIKSKVPAKYHGYIKLFIDREASTLPPHCDQDIKIELEEG